MTTDDVTRSRQAAVERRLKEREELIATVERAWPHDVGDLAGGVIADAILAAGWRKESDSSYEQGYRNGESSRDHDWTFPLNQVLPDRGPEWDWSPQAVADFIKAEMERNA